MIFDLLDDSAVERLLVIRDSRSGLRAFLVLDSLSLGPAVGGVRTRAYPTEQEALEDAARLASAMTVKCALAGLPAGGGKCVVMDHPRLSRGAAFEELGRRVEELGGLFRTAGDLGTTAADLERMARYTQFVHTEEGLATAVGRSLLRSAEAAAAQLGWEGLDGRTAAIQGCGAIGEAVAVALSSAGCRLYLSDIDAGRAETVAHLIGGSVAPPDGFFAMDVDILSPCAAGGVITKETATSLKAKAVVGAANNILTGEEAGGILFERGIAFVPDVIASAGAVVEGIGRTLMNLPDRKELIDRLGQVAAEVLKEAAETETPPDEVARRRAARIIQRARAGDRR